LARLIVGDVDLGNRLVRIQTTFCCTLTRQCELVLVLLLLRYVLNKPLAQIRREVSHSCKVCEGFCCPVGMGHPSRSCCCCPPRFLPATLEASCLTANAGSSQTTRQKAQSTGQQSIAMVSFNNSVYCYANMNQWSHDHYGVCRTLLRALPPQLHVPLSTMATPSLPLNSK
jgi:hypothetical protein